MARQFSNKDLNKPLAQMNPKPTSRVYTNADLKVQDDFVPDDFQPDDDFVPDDVQDTPEIVTPQHGASGTRLPAADTYGEGFARSVLESVADAPEQIKAYGEGMIHNLPQNIMSGIKMLGQGALLAAGPVGEMISGRSMGDRLKGIGESAVDMGKNIYDTAANSAEDPRAWARLMGEMTGQPLLMEGGLKAAPSVIRGAGYPVEFGGSIMKKYGATPIPRILESRLQRGLERAAGAGIEKLGAKMKTFGKGKGNVIVTGGKVTDPGTSPLQEGQAITPDANISYRRPLGEEAAPAQPTKPNVRLNRDGTFTNLDTGEVFDAKGKPLGGTVEPMDPGVPTEVPIEQPVDTIAPESMESIPDQDLQMFADEVVQPEPPISEPQVPLTENPPFNPWQGKWTPEGSEAFNKWLKEREALPFEEPINRTGRYQPTQEVLNRWYSEIDNQPLEGFGLQEGAELSPPPKGMVRPQGNIAVEPPSIAKQVLAEEPVLSEGQSISLADQAMNAPRRPVPGVNEIGNNFLSSRDLAELQRRSIETSDEFRRITDEMDARNRLKPAPKTAPKDRTIENAPPNQRARMMRGAHDAVDIFFEDSASREIFGAGQNLWSKGQMKPGMVKRITEAANRVSEKYKLTPEQARKAISGYNKAIRELGSSQPKYGESLNFKAPSFEEFLKDFKS